MKSKKHLSMIITAVLVLSVCCMNIATTDVGAASKKVVKPSGKKDNTDVKRINKALKKYGTVKLKKGKKYYLTSPITLRSNRTLDATGAVIVGKKDLISAKIKKANYENLKNVTIKGGTWKYKSKKGYNRTSMSFVHSSNIKLLNMGIKSANYNGHAIELVGCKDVLISNVKIKPCGTAKKSQETMVQIDIATNATYPRLKGTGLGNGATCQNIVIQNCRITGNRGIATGYDYNNSGYQGRMHTGIRIQNNTITGKNAEGLFLVNTENATVTGNTIVSEYTNYSSDKAIGLHYLMIAKSDRATLVCSNNTIKGGKYAVRAYSQSGRNLFTVMLLNNRCYCKKGASSAIQAANKGIDELFMDGNTTYTWK